MKTQDSPDTEYITQEKIAIDSAKQVNITISDNPLFIGHAELLFKKKNDEISVEVLNMSKVRTNEK